jgi:tetratricopeptide (TPR) repeat protein
MKALDAGKYDEAAALFQQAISADPKDYAAHFNLGLAYGFLNKDAEGVAEYRKALELKPGLYEAEMNGAILLLRQKKAEEALPWLEEAAQQKPADARTRYYLAEAQLQTGSPDKAEAGFRAALETDPKMAKAELGLAHSLARQAKPDEAEPHFRRAAELDQGYRNALLELAGLYETSGHPEKAVAIYREFPDNAAARERLNQLTLEGYLSTGDAEKALPLMAEKVAADPSNADLRMTYGRLLRDRKQYPAAAAQFAAAAKLKPTDAKAWSELGGMLYMMGDLPQALAAYDRARGAGENTAGNWFLHAIILDKLKQPKPALEAYQRFLAMSQGKNPDQEFQARQRSRILQREIDKR